MFDLEIKNDRAFITSKVNYCIDVFIYSITPWDNTPRKSITHTFKTNGSWVMFPYDLNNISKIIVRHDKTHHSFILPKKESSINRKKIICVGLNKTGTTSLKNGAESIGLKTYPENIGHQFLSHSVMNGSYGSMISAIENKEYDLYEDIPFSFPKIYEKLFKYFPNEKYVLTVRDSVDEWVNSVINFYGNALNIEKIQNFDNKLPYSINYCDVEIHKVYNWGHPMFDSWGLTSTDNLEEKLKTIYLNHIRDFKEFMEKNNGDYMIINVSKKDELKKFSLWLGIETNINNFGHFNKTTT
jgi:hypothetical protein